MYETYPIDRLFHVWNMSGMALNGEDVVSFERDDLHREALRHYANGLSQQQCYDEVGSLTQQLMLNGHDKGYQEQT
ncbi:hypothetical protein [Acinetobacter calcoaceticus]|uniref:hypothetical protein n=1 Tax=Acinetobacter calcoaceticus TaxID=471 RepID=UPI00192B5661|nr:hypothetical protein [Acinetobacter calcoaceticus]